MNKRQRLVLVISILASFVAFLDGSVVNVALPAMTRSLGGGLAFQQWVIDGYLLTLGSLILIAGSLSDVLGRKRILVLGLLGFGVASVACAVAPNADFLIAARLAQGAAGALLVPSSLALIIATFSGAAQGKAIGQWTAWTGISFIVGPLVGGYLVDAASWRWTFGINVVPIVITLGLLRILNTSDDAGSGGRIDVWGAVLCALGLGGTVYALIEQPSLGWGNPMIFGPLVAGVAFLAAFLRYEARAKAPMLPLALFKVRNFWAGNLATAFIYAGLSSNFVIVVFIQQVAHYSALAAGLALLPVTIIMFVLSGRFGALAGRFGARWFMTAGPLVGAAGFLLLLRVDEHARYWTQLLPGVLAFGLGLSMTVAPLTSAVLGSISSEHAGIGSAINNAVSRVAGLLAVAAIGVIVGQQLNVTGFHRALVAVAVLLAVGGVVSALGIRGRTAGSAI